MNRIKKEDLAGKPLFFEDTRAYRCYTGGALIDRLLCKDEEVDCYYPEAWIASTTRADNGPGHPKDEGLSRIKLPDGSVGPFFADLLPEFSETIFGSKEKGAESFPVLCKFLDAAMRLSLQVHPDRKFAEKYFNSKYGKTECWMILETRVIDGIEPYILVGFKEGVCKEKVAEAIEEKDFEKLESYFHKVPVKPGDVWFIPGGFPHAIGTGVFLLEIQEPTDLIIQPELSCGEVEFSEYDRWGGLEPYIALDCFNYEENTLESLHEKYFLKRKELEVQLGGKRSVVVGDGYDECFHVEVLEIESEFELAPSESWVLAISVMGSGILCLDGIEYPVTQGAAVLLPAEKRAKFISDNENKNGFEVYLVTQ